MRAREREREREIEKYSLLGAQLYGVLACLTAAVRVAGTAVPVLVAVAFGEGDRRVGIYCDFAISKCQRDESAQGPAARGGGQGGGGGQKQKERSAEQHTLRKAPAGTLLAVPRAVGAGAAVVEVVVVLPDLTHAVGEAGPAGGATGGVVLVGELLGG